jgi:hypothetical protein
MVMFKGALKHEFLDPASCRVTPASCGGLVAATAATACLSLSHTRQSLFQGLGAGQATPLATALYCLLFIELAYSYVIMVS